MHQDIKFTKGVYVLREKIYFFRKNVFDLHTISQSTMFQIVPKTPWPLIDTMLTTPAMMHFKKMPAMFNAWNVVSRPLSDRPRRRPKNIGTSKSDECNPF